MRCQARQSRRKGLVMGDFSRRPHQAFLRSRQHLRTFRALRAGIRDLARRVIAQDPMNATAYRLLGETTDDSEASHGALIEAVARSRRELVATFLLLHRAHEKSNYAEVVQLADVLLLTQPALNRFTLSYLYSLVLMPEGREAVAETLARNPSWRWIFFASLAGQMTGASDAPLALFQQLQSKGGNVTEFGTRPTFMGSHRRRQIGWRRLQYLAATAVA